MTFSQEPTSFHLQHGDKIPTRIIASYSSRSSGVSLPSVHFVGHFLDPPWHLSVGT
jgi:hypothetical protein